MDCLIYDVPPAKLARFIIHTLTMKKLECKNRSSRMIFDAAIRILLSEDDSMVFPKDLDSKVTCALHKALYNTEQSQNHIASAKILNKSISGQEEIELKVKKRCRPKHSDLELKVKKRCRPKHSDFSVNLKNKTQANDSCKGNKKQNSVLSHPKKVFLQHSPRMIECTDRADAAGIRKLKNLNSNAEEIDLMTKRRLQLSQPVSSFNKKHTARGNGLKIKAIPSTDLLTPKNVLLHKLPYKRKHVPLIHKVKNSSFCEKDIVSTKMSKKVNSNQQETEAKRPHTGQENKPKKIRQENQDLYEIKENKTVTVAPTHIDVAGDKMSNNLNADQEDTVLRPRQRPEPDQSDVATTEKNKPEHCRSEIKENTELSSFHKDISSHESSSAENRISPFSEFTKPPFHCTKIQCPTDQSYVATTEKNKREHCRSEIKENTELPSFHKEISSHESSSAENRISPFSEFIKPPFHCTKIQCPTDQSYVATTEKNKREHCRSEIKENTELPSFHKEISSHESSSAENRISPFCEFTKPPFHCTKIQCPKVYRKQLFPLLPVPCNWTCSNRLFGTNSTDEPLTIKGSRLTDETKNMSFATLSSAERVPPEPEPKKRPLIPLPTGKSVSEHEMNTPPLQSHRKVLLPTPRSKLNVYCHRRMQYSTYYYQRSIETSS